MNYKEIYMEKYLAGSDLDGFPGSFQTWINTKQSQNITVICVQCEIKEMV